MGLPQDFENSYTVAEICEEEEKDTPKEQKTRKGYGSYMRYKNTVKIESSENMGASEKLRNNGRETPPMGELGHRAKSLLWKGMEKEPGIDGILVTVGLCIIALLLCVVMKDSLQTFIETIVTAMTTEAQKILTGVSG